MKWITEWVPAAKAPDRLMELVKDGWFVSQIHPIPSTSTAVIDRVFLAACQREPKGKLKKDR